MNVFTYLQLTPDGKALSITGDETAIKDMSKMPTRLFRVSAGVFLAHTVEEFDGTGWVKVTEKAL